MRPVALLFCLLLILLGSSIPLAAQQLHDTGMTAVISRIEISGNEITRSPVILREMNIREGDTIQVDQLPEILQEAKRRLLNLTIFTTCEIHSNWSVGKPLIIQVTVQERWHIIPNPIFQLADRNFNVWWTEMHRDLRRINAGIKVTDNNFRGNLESLSATVQAGYTPLLALEYMRPYIDKRQQQGIGFGISVSQSGELAYKTDSNKLLFARLPGSHIIRQYDGSFTWYYRPGYPIRHSLTIGWHDYGISDTVLRLNRNYFGNGSNTLKYGDLTYRQDYNGVDNWNYPLRGIKSVNYLILRSTFQAEGWQAQWHTETGAFFQPSGKDGRLFVSAILRGRLMWQQGTPYFFQSALGTKTDYVRGYEYYVVDGSSYALLRFDLKYALFKKNFGGLPFQYLPEIPVRILPKLFADAGYAHHPTPGNSYLNDRLLYSAGVGVDIVTTYDIKIRLEAAVNHLGQYGLYLHLNSE